MVGRISFGPLDLAIVCLYVLALLALGFSAKLRQNTALQFIAAGRQLTLPLFVATLVCTWYGGILGVGESVATFGVGTWILLGVPYYVFAIVYALVFASRVREAEQISIPERLELRYGKAVALLGAVLVFLLAVPAAHVLMLGVLTSLFTGWNIIPSVIIATLVGTLFLYRGGLLADARASILAFLMMYVGFAMIVGYCLLHHPPATAFRAIEPRLLSWDGGSGWTYVLSFFILGAWTLIDPGFHQRVASASAPAIGRRGVLISVGFWMLFDLLSVSTGLYALALEPTLAQGATKLERLSMFPLLGDHVLPPGLKAVFFCGMLGTILCAMVGYSLVSGATIGREIVCRVRSAASEDQVTLWSRVGIAVATVTAIGLALSISSVVDLWFQWAGAVIGCLLIPVCLAYLGPRTMSPQTAFASMAAGFVVSLAWLGYGRTTGNEYLEVELGGAKFSIGTLLPGLVVSAMVALCGETWEKLRKRNERTASRR